jgi:hypothetical protein
VHIAYGEVTFELTRYDVGGKVTDRDVEVAKKISSVYRARSRRDSLLGSQNFQEGRQIGRVHPGSHSARSHAADQAVRIIRDEDASVYAVNREPR